MQRASMEVTQTFQVEIDAETLQELARADANIATLESETLPNIEIELSSEAKRLVTVGDG